jgi:hypothetical protein
MPNMTEPRPSDRFRIWGAARQNIWLLIVALVVLSLAVPAWALDIRCETGSDRPQCQTPDTDTTTTTTMPPQITTTTTIPIPSGFGATSVIGCSNTNHAAAGYGDLSDLGHLINTAWAGHTIEYWATNTAPWDEHYLPLRPDEGFDSAWLNLCERADQGLTLENVELVLSKIWEIDPNIPVWISPLNYYEGEGCLVTNGNQVPTEGAVIADALVANDDLLMRGPDLGPLSDELLRADECHPNRSGTEFLGSQLVAFFDF